MKITQQELDQIKKNQEKDMEFVANLGGTYADLILVNDKKTDLENKIAELEKGFIQHNKLAYSYITRLIEHYKAISINMETGEIIEK